MHDFRKTTINTKLHSIISNNAERWLMRTDKDIDAVHGADDISGGKNEENGFAPDESATLAHCAADSVDNYLPADKTGNQPCESREEAEIPGRDTGSGFTADEIPGQSAFYRAKTGSGLEKDIVSEDVSSADDHLLDKEFDSLIKGRYKTVWQRRTEAIVRKRLKTIKSRGNTSGTPMPNEENTEDGCDKTGQKKNSLKNSKEMTAETEINSESGKGNSLKVAAGFSPDYDEAEKAGAGVFINLNEGAASAEAVELTAREGGSNFADRTENGSEAGYSTSEQNSFLKGSAAQQTENAAFFGPDIEITVDSSALDFNACDGKEKTALPEKTEGNSRKIMTEGVIGSQHIAVQEEVFDAENPGSKERADFAGVFTGYLKAKERNLKRPVENGCSGSCGVVTRINVSALSGNDILSILRRVGAGEKITFK